MFCETGTQKGGDKIPEVGGTFQGTEPSTLQKDLAGSCQAKRNWACLWLMGVYQGSQFLLPFSPFKATGGTWMGKTNLKLDIYLVFKMISGIFTF